MGAPRHSPGRPRPRDRCGERRHGGWAARHQPRHHDDGYRLRLRHGRSRRAAARRVRGPRRRTPRGRDCVALRQQQLRRRVELDHAPPHDGMGEGTRRSDSRRAARRARHRLRLVVHRVGARAAPRRRCALSDDEVHRAARNGARATRRASDPHAREPRDTSCGSPSRSNERRRKCPPVETRPEPADRCPIRRCVRPRRPAAR